MTKVKQQLQKILKRLEGRSEAAPEESLQQILSFPAKQIIPKLIEEVEKSPHYLVRLVSVMALGELKAEKAIPALVRALSDSSLTVQRAAADALVKIGRPSVYSLLERIGHEDLSVRRWVIQILGRIGAKGAAPVLLERFSKEAPELQRLIIEALGEIGSKKAFKLLAELVKQAGAQAFDFQTKVNSESVIILASFKPIWELNSADVAANQVTPQELAKKIKKAISRSFLRERLSGRL